MAKNKKYDKEEGVWRTIGGRRVFIRTGQSLSDAMKESGKFNKASDVSRNEYQDRKAELKRDNLRNQWHEADLKAHKEDLKFMKDKINYEGNRLELGEKAYNLKEDYEFARDIVKDRIDSEEYKGNLSNLEGKHIEKESWDKQVARETKVSQEGLSKLKDEGNNKSGNDYLPKASKIETAGTSNRKEVSDNIQAHILEHYDNPVDFMEQMDAMDYLPTRWRAGEELASGGSYLIYYDDQRDFLNSLNINPKGKEFSDDRVAQTYNSLIGRESERLYNRLEKLYEQYKKEHKDTDVSLDDFRKWFR